MELQLKIDTEKKTDRALFATLGLLMHSYSKVLDDIDKDLTEEEEREENESNEQTSQPEAKQEETTEETPVAETPAEPSPEKPKRTRKKKAEPVAEETPVEETPEEAPVAGMQPEDDAPAEAPEAEQGELPFDKEVEQPAEEEVKTLNYDEWTKILSDKRKEFGVTYESPKRTEFNSLVMSLSKPYGAKLPRDLSDEARYKFVTEKFNNIDIDGEGKFYVKPF